MLNSLTLNKGSESNSLLSLTLSLQVPPPAGSCQRCWISAVFQGLDSALETSERKQVLALSLPGLKPHRVRAAAAAKYRCGKQTCTKEPSTCVQPPGAVLSWSKGLSLFFLSLATRLGPLRGVVQDSEEQLGFCRLGWSECRCRQGCWEQMVDRYATVGLNLCHRVSSINSQTPQKQK